MDGQVQMIMLIDNVDPEQFLLGTFTSISSHKDKQKSNTSFTQIGNLKQRESAIIKDFLYVLLGKNGVYITSNVTADNNDVYKSLKGRVYSIDKDIDINFKDIANELALIGTKVSALLYFDKYFHRPSHGKVISRLCEFIRSFFSDYYLTINQLENSHNNDPTFSIISLFQELNTIPTESSICSIIQCINHLYSFTQLLIEENNKRMENSNLIDMKFENIMKSLKEDLNSNSFDDIVIDSQNSKYIKGGLVLNILQDEIDKYSGNHRSSDFLVQIYESISIDYIEILNNWLHLGVIFDPFDDFFIVEAKSDVNLYNSYYWINKFAIKKDGLLKQFNSIDIQKKIFLSGRYLTIIRECHYGNLIENQPFTKLTSLRDINMNIRINESYLRVNKIMKQLLYNGYKLPRFMMLMNKYFLLEDGFLFDSFLNKSNHELKRSFTITLTQEISRYYEIAYSTTSSDDVQKLFSDLLETKFEKNSLFDDILKIIKTKVTDANEIMNASSIGNLTDLLKANLQSNDVIGAANKSSNIESQRCNKLTISKFNIDIKLPFPFNQIIIESQKLEYQILFRHSALVKFLEKRLEKSWRELGYQTFWTWNFDDIRIRKWIKKCRFIHTKMFDFIRIYSFYFKHDSIETNWYNVKTMLEYSEQDDRVFDLSEFKFQLTEFLSSSLSDALLSQAKLLKGLYDLFTLIIVFHEYVLSLRKALLLLDESLLESQKQRLNITVKFDQNEKEKRLKNLIEVLDSFHLTFQNKLMNLSQNLAYYGEIDSPKILILYTKLISAFKI